jgi:hypothetical protein
MILISGAQIPQSAFFCVIIQAFIFIPAASVSCQLKHLLHDNHYQQQSICTAFPWGGSQSQQCEQQL